MFVGNVDAENSIRSPFSNPWAVDVIILVDVSIPLIDPLPLWISKNLVTSLFSSS